jgi:hypothetical protein
MPKSKRASGKQNSQHRKSTRSRSRKAAAIAVEKTTKGGSIISLLSRAGGATIDEIVKATGWQAHSVRGFFAGHVRKKLGLTLSFEKSADGIRRYRIVS